MLGSINLFAVIVATVAGMLVGFVWFSPVLFGRHWMELVNKSKNELGGEGKAMFFMFLGTFVMAFVLAMLINLVNATTAAAGLQLGFLLWLGLVATVLISDVLFLKKPFRLYLINAGHVLFELLIMSAILAGWR